MVLPVALWPWGRLDLQQEWIPGIYPVCRADKLTTFVCRFSINSENLNPLELSGPVQGLLYLYLLPLIGRLLLSSVGFLFISISVPDKYWCLLLCFEVWNLFVKISVTFSPRQWSELTSLHSYPLLISGLSVLSFFFLFVLFAFLIQLPFVLVSFNCRVNTIMTFFIVSPIDDSTPLSCLNTHTHTHTHIHTYTLTDNAVQRNMAVESRFLEEVSVSNLVL